MDHQKVFSTHIFVKDNYLVPQRLPAMQQEIRNLHKLGYTNNNWQTGPDLDKTESFKWFASDIGKTAFDIFDKFKDVQFYKVNRGKQKTASTINEWSKCENLKYISIEEMDQKLYN